MCVLESFIVFVVAVYIINNIHIIDMSGTAISVLQFSETRIAVITVIYRTVDMKPNIVIT
jgi:hypothetical protein